MVESMSFDQSSGTRSRKSSNASKSRLFMGLMLVALVLGLITGYLLISKSGSGSTPAELVGSVVNPQPKSAQQDTSTFKDFAEGVIEPMPTSPAGGYVEGTHLLKRDGATPVALTSSVVDLSQYEGKKVRVFGETQKALKAGWLMDVGKVEEIK